VGPGLVGSLWRYRLVIVTVAALAAIAGYAASLLLPARYEAQASLYLRDPGSPAVLNLGESTQPGDHTIFMATQAALVGSDAVYGRALQLLKRGGTPADVGRSVVVGPSADLASITIRSTADNPAEAANLANAVGTAYQQVAGERTAANTKDAIMWLQKIMAEREAQFDSQRAQAEQASGAAQRIIEGKAINTAALIYKMQEQQQDIAAQGALYGSGVDSFQEAVPPVSSSQPTPLQLALIGAVLGLLAAGVWAWWAAGRDRRVEAEGDAGAILAVPLLGETPRLDMKPDGTGGPSSPPDELDPLVAEAYHIVLASLAHALSRMGGKVVAVASPMSGDGKTVTVLNLALAARREGRNVLLIDADGRTRRLSQLCRDGEHFDVIGVSHDGDLIHDGGRCPEVSVKRWPPSPRPRPRSPTRGTVLQVESSERNGHHPAVFFRSKAFDRLISFSGEPADIVLIDTPALLGASEAVTIADHADAILLVVNRGTSLADLRRARERLAFTDTPLIGYLLNRRFAARRYAGNGGAGGGSPARGLLRRWGDGKLPQQARQADLRARAPRPAWHSKADPSQSYRRFMARQPTPAPRNRPTPAAGPPPTARQAEPRNQSTSEDEEGETSRR
jgi:Mrp family chromosome partitioning ATPase/capsular polysaccharide biosynthesis protein